MVKAPALSDPSRLRFSPVAIVLHWTIAALMLTNIVLAWKFNGLKAGLRWYELIQLHKSIGITVLLLTVLRLLWRLVHPPPAYPPEMKSWEKAAAVAVRTDKLIEPPAGGRPGALRQGSAACARARGPG